MWDFKAPHSVPPNSFNELLRKLKSFAGTQQMIKIKRKTLYEFSQKLPEKHTIPCSDHTAWLLTSQCSLTQILWSAVTWQISVCGFIMCFIEGYVFMDREDWQYWTKQVWQIAYKHFRVYLMLFHRIQYFGNNSDQNFSDMLRFSVYLKTVYFTSAVENPCVT